MAEVSDAGKGRLAGSVRVASIVAFACWMVGTLVFAALPAGSEGRYLLSSALYYAAAGFVLISLSRTITGTRDRLLWGLLGAGMATLFLGNLGWSALQQGLLGEQVASYRHVAYVISYLFFAGAMLLLVSLTTRRITLIAALDALAVALSVGLLARYFLVPAAGGAGSVTAALSWLALDAALLFLSLVVLSTTGKPRFVGAITAGFLAFVAADGLFLTALAGGDSGDAGWHGVLWALGLLFFGFAALRAAPVGFSGQRIEPWRIFAFWLSPLSPPIHLGVVLLWGATHPPVPPFAAAGGAALFLYLALRVALVSFTTRRLADDQEELARRLEGSRVLSELHDTVKQGVHVISLILRSALEAERRGEQEDARDLVENALRAAREAEFQVSRPYEELHTSVHSEGAPRPGDYLRHRLARFEEYFGIKTHEDLQAPLEALSPVEVAVVYRVVVEAFWNVAKHSKANNMHLESRQVGNLLLLRVRDDGHGFDLTDPPPGMGLSYMRQRAREVGADLDVISAPGRGTTVQLRFRTR